MKIEKLYTLSQFVELLDNAIDGYFITREEINSEKYDLIVKYNDFLKQPLKKEMFVNEIEKPNENNSKYRHINWDKSFKQNEFDKDFGAWQEAEKKVIFEGKIRTDNIFGTGKIEDALNIYIKNHHLVYNLCKKDTICFNYDITQLEINLHRLAEKTNGELELKNVEI